MPAKKKTASAPDFEQSMNELEELVEAMESGKLSLEQSMEHFERGIKLTKNCQKSLTEAEQRVQILMKEAGQEKLVDFEPDEE